jgi:biotin operon repressor
MMDYNEANILNVVADMRRKNHSKDEIAEVIGHSTAAVTHRIKKLYELGRLTEEQAFGSRGRPISKRAMRLRCGNAGMSVVALLTVDEAARLGKAVSEGRYAGYNEFLVELLRDWIAEEDAKKARLGGV